jgi:hypothetical protein
MSQPDPSGSQAQGPDPLEKTPQVPQTPEEKMAMEEIPEEIRNALIELVKQSEREADLGRRGHFKQMLEAEEFWKGNHYPVWSENEFNFRTPWDYSVSHGHLDDQPTYQYKLNVYQAYGLSAIAALSNKVPKVRFFPHSGSSEIDISTARAASDIAELVEKNNNIRLMAIREAYLLWTQGGFGTYTRFVREFEKGIEEIPQIENRMTPVSDDVYNCQQCGYQIPAADAEASGQAAVTPLGQEQMLMTCPQCGGPLSDADFVPGEHAEVPVVTGITKMPEGYEKMSVYGFLNLKLAPTVKAFEDSGYLHLVEDVHEASIRAAHPDQHKEIGSGTSASSENASGNVSDTYEKNARMNLFEAPAQFSGQRASSQTAYLPYKRVWFRNWYLWSHPAADMREKLVAYFPGGVYISMAGDKFLEAREENVNDHWAVCSAMPGYGIYPQAMGSSLIPLNKQINDSYNIVAEHLDFGSAPPIFTDSEFISSDALSKQRMRPGAIIPIARSRGGMTRNLRDLIFQPDIKIDSNIYSYGRSLFELGEVISGVMPTIYGGQLRGNETLGAAQMSRDQALGKLQLFWTAVKQHHAQCMRIAVECFRRNRTQDAEKVILGKSNDFVSKYIRLAEIKGSIIAEPEADEDFPQTWAEIRNNFNELMKTAPEMAGALLQEPANIALLKKYLGSPNIVFSAEANREQQFREIDELLAAEPIEMPDLTAVVADPMTGAPPTIMVSTVPVNVHADDHTTHIKTIMEWASSADGGLLAKKENPGGYANVMAHLIEHKKGIVEVAAFDVSLQAAAGIMPAGPEEGGEEAGGAPRDKGAAPPGSPA